MSRTGVDMSPYKLRCVEHESPLCPECCVILGSVSFDRHLYECRHCLVDERCSGNPVAGPSDVGLSQVLILKYLSSRHDVCDIVVIHYIFMHASITHTEVSLSQVMGSSPTTWRRYYDLKRCVMLSTFTYQNSTMQFKHAMCNINYIIDRRDSTFSNNHSMPRDSITSSRLFQVCARRTSCHRFDGRMAQRDARRAPGAKCCRGSGGAA